MKHTRTEHFLRVVSLVLALFLAGAAPALAQEHEELRVGLWVVVRGELQEDGSLVASRVDVTEAQEEEVLQGTITTVDRRREWIEVLQQRVTLGDRVKWRSITADELLGARVEVEGHYRGLNKFSCRSIAPRGPGRDRIEGRLDAISSVDGRLELDIMRYRVLVPHDAEIVHEAPISSYALIEPRALPRAEAMLVQKGPDQRVDQDYLPGSIRLTDSLYLGLRAEFDTEAERDLDLNPDRARDRTDYAFVLRGVLVWTPVEQLYARIAARAALNFRQDDRDGDTHTTAERLTEAYFYWTRLFDEPLDIQLGRQDYYDEREWLWDQNLDAIRLHYRPGDWHLEVAAATTLEGGSPREQATDRWIATLTHGSKRRMWGAYLVDQRTDLNIRDYPVHAGLRAYGEWIPNNKVWLELGVVGGYEGGEDIRGWGFDVGTTWSPERADPWYFSAGYALGSGDGDPNDGVDHAFRQTGIQDNNDKFGGVTSFKYYGELLEPELSNLHILTLGIGRRFGRRFSADLVYHAYAQDQAFDRFRDANVDKRPNGVDTDLGQELDLILGHRGANGLDTELVLASFDPGRAFDDASNAYLLKLQVRYRF